VAASIWNIDPTHSAIHFAVRHMVVSKTRGRFAKWDGKLVFDPANPAASSSVCGAGHTRRTSSSTSRSSSRR